MGDSLASRLAYCCTVLRLIDCRRAESGNDGIGAAIERRILDRELRELEHLAAAEGICEREQAAAEEPVEYPPPARRTGWLLPKWRS
jgi:hypothetical protein